jgi:hypothetical protein
MKRDDDLIRDLLLKMEESDDSDYVCSLTMGSEPEEEREYFHLQLLGDAGYVLETGRHGGVFRVTNQGYDYLFGTKRRLRSKALEAGLLTSSRILRLL